MTAGYGTDCVVVLIITAIILIIIVLCSLLLSSLPTFVASFWNHCISCVVTASCQQYEVFMQGALKQSLDEH